MVLVKVIGISGSPRKGNTEILVKEALKAAEEVGDVEIEFIPLRGKKINPCLACYQCVDRKVLCIQQDDMLPLYKKFVEADGIIIGTPVYMYTVTAQLKAFMDRLTTLMKARFYPEAPFRGDFSKKVGGAIAVGYDRHGGVEHALATIIHFFLTMDIIVVSGYTPTSYIGAAAWTLGKTARDLEAVKEDKAGLEAARQVGRRVAETAKLIKLGLEYMNLRTRK